MRSLQNKIDCLDDPPWPTVYGALDFLTNNSYFHLVLLLSYYLNMEEPGQDQTDAPEGVYDDISLNNKPEKELTCKYRIRIEINSQIMT